MEKMAYCNAEQDGTHLSFLCRLSLFVFHVVLYFVFVELRNNLEMEKNARHDAEQKLLTAEKKNSEMCVDLTQYKQQIASTKQDLQAEVQKVRGNK